MELYMGMPHNLYPKIPTANIPKIPIKVSPFLLYGSTPLPENPSPL